MSYIVYDSGPYDGPRLNLSKMDATRQWLKHFSNSVLLTRIAQSPRDLEHKMQALRELDIAERKMRYWERQSSYDPLAAREEARRIKRSR